MTGMDIVQTVCIGVGATVWMDGWGAWQRWRGRPGLDYGLLGRLALGGGKLAPSQRRGPYARAERALGWALHYLIGVVFAVVLVAWQGVAWLTAPDWMPALGLGLITVLLPWLLLQPALGVGIAASKTAAPWRQRQRNLSTHLVFGVGLYVAARLWQGLAALA